MQYFFIPVILSVLALPGLASEIGPDALDSRLRADVVILGEVHDNPAHHLNQARAIRAIRPAALVFEMLTPEQAALVTASNRGDQDALAAALGWASSGWPDFALYWPVFAAAPDAAVFGGNLPRGKVRRAIGEGAAAVFGDGAAQFGLDKTLAEAEQDLREAGQAEAHCNALPEDLLPGMVEAQRLRDAALAAAVLNARAAVGGPIVVITGNGHVRRDWGVSAMLAMAGISALSVAQFELEAPDDPPFDLYLLTDAVERDDPCAVFRKD